MMKIVLVYNPKSGSAISASELKRRFSAAGITVVASYALQGDIDKKLRQHIQTKDQAIAVLGGDGTQSAIAGILANTQAVMAPLPGGTLNHFTKDLGINQDLDAAIGDLAKATPRPVDIATINNRIVINNSSVGLYPSALQMRDEMTKKSISKWPAAIIASLKAFWRYRSYTVTIDGETFRTPFIFIGNNDYRLEEQLIGARTRLDEGILSVYAISGANRKSLLKVILRTLFHQLETVNEVKIWKTTQLTIVTRKPRIRVSRDGEHEILETPLDYKINPGALLIIGGQNK